MLQCVFLLHSAFPILFASLLVAGDVLPECKSDDFHSEFTECDKDGGRWRVSVPRKSNSCTVNKDIYQNIPVRWDGCNSACNPGSFFNPEKLSCEKCLAGTYSLGDGISLHNADGLPGGFQISNEPIIRTDFRERNSQNKNETLNCSAYGWQVRGEFIASHGGPCSSSLTYSVKLVRSGTLSFSYQYTDETILFQFLVQNDKCQSVEETGINKMLTMTKEGEWLDVKVSLKAGLNVLHWKTIGMTLDRDRRYKAVLLKKIEVHGIAYAPTCSICNNGTYSEEGASVCLECPENTYSGREASTCINCKATEYSGKGSATCYLRPPCLKKDFYAFPTPCDENKKMHIEYKWIEPKICHDGLPKAVKLPLPGEKKNCPPCNSGMQYTNASVCSFCPVNHCSDGRSSCKACPPSTAPNYHYNYSYWNSWPPNMKSSCLSLDDAGCRYLEGWQIADTYIHSGQGHDDGAYLILALEVPGFRSSGGILAGRPIEIAKISFEFETHCSADCEFSFMQSSRIGVYIIQTWNGTQSKQKYSFSVTQNDSYTFRWVFQKVNIDKSYTFDASSTEKFISDEVRIYSIIVTNTIDGGAEMCIPCRQGVTQNGCVPCPAGHYVNPNTTACTKCPPNTYVSDPLAYGVESCEECGPGLRSTDGQSCFSDCKLDLNGVQYDFSSALGNHVVEGSHLFTTSGTQYYHLFNISLCGENIVGKTICSNNVSNHIPGTDRERILAIICRSTLVPPKFPDDESLSTQAVSLGDHLLGVTTATSLGNIKIPQEFLASKKDSQIGKVPDVNFYYASSVTTRACQHGRSSTITLRCDTSQDADGTIQLPKSCPDGTCDGCSFHFLWLTKSACPLCSIDSFQVVNGECSNGEQVLHYISPKHCLLPPKVELPSNKIRKCTVIPRELKIIIIIAAVLAFFLLMLVIYFWKKNRKLEYKYMKLVHSSNSKDGELPPAESCAIDDEEEDHFDSVQFKESKSKILLNKIRSMAGNKKDSDNPFETIQLTEKENLS